MKNIQYTFFIFSVSLFASLSTYANNDSVKKAVEPLFLEAVSADSVPGISVAVADSGGIAWAKGYGYSDLENTVLMNSKHSLRVGSVAKVLTAAAVMRLHEKGKIDLDKPVTQYTQQWPSIHPAITLRQLTAHTSGIRHYKSGGNEFLLNQYFVDMKSALALFQDDPLSFEPGAQFQYTTFGWTLVSAVLEAADAERSFQQIMQQEVFTPLNMQDTHFDDQYQIIANRPRPYSYYQGMLVNAPQTDHSYKWAGGGFIASPSDISRFAVAHLNGHYLQADTAQLMFTQASLNNGEKVQYGIGWEISFDRYKKRPEYIQNSKAQSMMEAMPDAVMHAGSSMGGTSMLILCSEHGRAVTVVKNVSGEDNADVFLLALQTLSVFHQD